MYMRLFWKIVLGIIGCFMFVLMIGVLAFTVSVKPGVYIIQKMFDQPIVISDEEMFMEASSKVQSLKDITYPSSYKNNTLDIYYPKNAKDSVPVLIWLHGGGFVSGNKEGVEEFATYIAAYNGVAVVAIDYETAPSLQYPGQIKQLDDVYTFISNQSKDFPMLDISNLSFGGDSAGAQIAGQYVALQTNEAYAKEMNIEQSVPSSTIRTFLSFSGPVDLQQMKDVQSDSLFMKFFVNTVSRAFIGTRNWKTSELLVEGSVVPFVTENFPPTYITDGNSFSFPEQGKALQEALETVGVPVDILLFDEGVGEIPHEYQFNFLTDEAKENLNKTIQFIDTYGMEEGDDH